MSKQMNNASSVDSFISQGVTQAFYAKPGVNIKTQAVPNLQTPPSYITTDTLYRHRIGANTILPALNATVVGGVATTLAVVGPATGDIAQYEYLLAIEVTFQLNLNNIPTSLFNLQLQYNGLDGNPIALRTQNVTGTLNIVNNDAAPSILFLPFIRQSNASPAGTGAGYTDTVSASSNYKYDAPIFNYMSATQQPTPTPAQMLAFFPSWVVECLITMPINAATAGLVLTVQPFTTGNDADVADFINTVLANVSK
jgi:hypothetical protein